MNGMLPTTNQEKMLASYQILKLFWRYTQSAKYNDIIFLHFHHKHHTLETISLAYCRGYRLLVVPGLAFFEIWAFTHSAEI